MAPTLAVSKLVTIRCECGDVFDVTNRTYRRHLAQNTVPRCCFCRRRTYRVIEGKRYRNFWLKRYSQEWIEETAFMIWGLNGDGTVSWTDGH